MAFGKKKKEQTIATREFLLKKEVLEIVKVDLGDDQIVYVRQMTGHERDQFESLLVTKIKNKKGKTFDFEQNLEDFRAKLVVSCICDEAGILLLKPQDYKELSNNMSAFRLEKIVNVAQKINKISDEDKEELVKNSDADQVGNSNSDSVKN